MTLQPPAKRNEARRLVTHAPLPIAWEGERRSGESSFFHVEVCARRNLATSALEWEVLQAWPKASKAKAEAPRSEE